MTDSNLIGVCLVVDRSGSMDAIKDDAQGAINGFLDGRRRQAVGDQRVSVRVVQFDDRYEVVHPSMAAQDVPPFELDPWGSTALLDAMGRGITEYGEELAQMPESARPAAVVFAVMTDGRENSSEEWTYERVAELVTRQQEIYGWNVVYLGANQDAVAEAAKLGVRRGSAMTYNSSAAGTRSTVDSLDSYVVAVASAGPLRDNVSFSEEDRRKAQR